MLCAVYLLSREGAMLTGKSITEEKGLILIDSGHGGIDPGVVGIDGVKEKDINLKMQSFPTKSRFQRKAASYISSFIL